MVAVVASTVSCRTAAIRYGRYVNCRSVVRCYCRPSRRRSSSSPGTAAHGFPVHSLRVVLDHCVRIPCNARLIDPSDYPVVVHLSVDILDAVEKDVLMWMLRIRGFGSYFNCGLPWIPVAEIQCPHSSSTVVRIRWKLCSVQSLKKNIKILKTSFHSKTVLYTHTRDIVIEKLSPLHEHVGNGGERRISIHVDIIAYLTGRRQWTTCDGTTYTLDVVVVDRR